MFSVLVRSTLAFALAAVAISARGAVVDFENLANIGTLGYTTYGSPIVSGGFSFEESVGRFFSATPGSTLYNYTGSVAVGAYGPDETITMTQLGGGAFSLSSMQLANAYPSGSIGGQGSTVTFTGTRADGSGTVSRQFTVVAGNALQTATFSGFVGLSSVSWVQVANYHVFDNINVSPVPEPSAFAALGLGAAAVLGRRRRK